MSAQPSYQREAVPSRCGAIWNRSDFLEIQAIIGESSAEKLLRSYGAHLAAASATLRGPALDAAGMREATHDLKSMSGHLGFEALKDFCEMLLAAGNERPVAATVEPLLSLIDASSEAAENYCRRPAATKAT